jgi:hypothetical protein
MAFPATHSDIIRAMAREAIDKEADTNSMMLPLGGVFRVAEFAGTGSLVSKIGVSAVLALVGAIVGMWIPGRSTAENLIQDSLSRPNSYMTHTQTIKNEGKHL